MARILIADEHPMTRLALRLLLQEQLHSIVGEARDGLEALSLAASLTPDLLIIDLDLSRITGLDVISHLRARGVQQPILGFSTQDSRHFVSRFLQAGASGFVSKHQEPDVLKEAIAVLLRGQTYFSSELLGSVHRNSLQEKDAERIASLSNRELSVLSLLASGYSNQQIAKELTIGEKSVSTYRARLRAKLNLHNMLDLFDFARRNRLAAPANQLHAPVAEHREDAEMWRSMVQSLPAAFYVRDTEARLVYANPAHLAMYHAQLEQILGTLTTEVDWYKPGDARNMLLFLQRAIAEERAFDKDIELSIHGQRRVLHHWGTPYRDAQGQMLGMICCSTDITRRYEQLDALRARAESAELAQRQLLELLDSVSQQMTAGLAELGATLAADGSQLPSRAGEQLRDLQGHLQQLQRALHTPEPADQATITTDLVELSVQVLRDLRGRAEQKQISLFLDSDNLSRSCVMADRTRLHELLCHLGRYAIDLSPAGEVRLSLACTAKQTHLGVRMTFRGSPEPTTEPQRAYSLTELTRDASTAEQPRNRLDLNLARHLASQLGADLQVTHLPEQGLTATLHVLLPIAPV